MRTREPIYESSAVKLQVSMHPATAACWPTKADTFPTESYRNGFGCNFFDDGKIVDITWYIF